jgi:hypothetical protein
MNTKLHLKVVPFGSVFCFCLIFVIVACDGGWRESFYPSLADAGKAGEITRGWIPDFLPKSAKRIHEAHRIEHPRTWCAFEFSPPDSEDLRKNLQAVDTLPTSVTRILSPGVPWWPTVLEGDLDLKKVNGAGLELYKVVRPNVVASRSEIILFAMDWTKGRGFFYQTYYEGHE